MLEILRVEQRTGQLVGTALLRYREFLSPPRQWPLYPMPDVCSCPSCRLDDVRNARDVLEDALEQLPPRARAELRRRVMALDKEYRRRTLPDLWSDQETWWRRRLTVH
ncbi:hypothetical protein DMH04_15220 [Kibdelosporangium aridum]|uniref:Uncharacterized protein n=1 Tax=Kibdelosporangium aridum TaxID=2030 RepID=A0A428ZDH0_KIBAR|nr:hypothetical protein DMH04_15220 [Kibdelosporangium aridum]